MAEINRDNFIAEYSELQKNAEFKELIESYKAKEQEVHENIFAMYDKDEDIVENGVYNEKNAWMVRIRVLRQAIKDFGAIKLSGIQYIVRNCESNIETIKKTISEQRWGMMTSVTMAMYTESDLELNKSLAYRLIYKYYDTELANFKKEKNEQTLV